MKTTLIRVSLLALFSAIIVSAPGQLLTQNTSKVSTEKKATAQTNAPASSEKTTKGGPFHGKLAALDKVGKTIMVGKRTFQITSETKIKKAGKPATLEDGVVGETVSGYVKPSADGKLIATTVNFGPKAVSDAGEAPKSAPEKEKQPK
jgi:hypothetical protein